MDHGLSRVSLLGAFWFVCEVYSVGLCVGSGKRNGVDAHRARLTALGGVFMVSDRETLRRP